MVKISGDAATSNDVRIGPSSFNFFPPQRPSFVLVSTTVWMFNIYIDIDVDARLCLLLNNRLIQLHDPCMEKSNAMLHWGIDRFESSTVNGSWCPSQGSFPFLQKSLENSRRSRCKICAQYRHFNARVTLLSHWNQECRSWVASKPDRANIKRWKIKLEIKT